MKHLITVDVVGAIRSKRNRGDFTLQRALMEFIDNSIDANANAVSITEDGDDLVIEDNGDGFSNIMDSIQIGESSKDGKIGRYGVGFKDASIKFSETTVVESKGVSVSIPWGSIAAKQVDPCVCPPEPTDFDKGARITLGDFRTRYKQSIQTDDIRRAYAPLLEDSKLALAVNGKALRALPMPSFIESIDVTIPFLGRTARVVGGIFAPDDPARRLWVGYHPYYMGRLIGNGRITSMGVGENPCSNFCFQVHLIDSEKSKWHLSTNKDESDDLHDLLTDIYLHHTEHLLEKGAQLAQSVESAKIEEFVNESAKVTNDRNLGNRTQGPALNHPGRKDLGKKTGRRLVNTFTATAFGDYVDQGDDEKRKSHKRKLYDFRFSNKGGEALGEITFCKRLLIEMNTANAWVAARSKDDSQRDAFLAASMVVFQMHESMKVDDLFSDTRIKAINDALEAAGAELHARQLREDASKQ